MLLNEKSKFTDREIIEKGSRALIKELGYSGFLRFIRHPERTNKGKRLINACNIPKTIATILAAYFNLIIQFCMLLEPLDPKEANYQSF